MNDTIREEVQRYYGEVLQHSDDLKTNACCAVGAPASWLKGLLANIHPDVSARFYGCGFPITEALEGATVVDLGCGTGRDAYLLSQLVGPDGHVHGVDMTEAQLEVARRTVDWHMERFGFSKPNVSFHHGYIEDLSALDIESDSVDLVVSNCVVNLSPRKDRVLAEVSRILRPGGEFHFSDVFADRRLPPEVASDPVLYGECLGGALYDGDFVSLAWRSGFRDPRTVEAAPITIMNEDVERKVGAARFRSITWRLFKLAQLDDRCEDYGQVAVYKGTIPQVGDVFTLDDHHVFEAGRPERVCGNTAAMLAETRYAPHFEIVGDTSTHFGVFDCSATMASTARATDSAGAASGSCC